MEKIGWLISGCIHFLVIVANFRRLLPKERNYGLVSDNVATE